MKVTCDSNVIEFFNRLIALVPSVTSSTFSDLPLKPSFFGFKNEKGKHSFGFISSIQKDYSNITDETARIGVGLGQLSTKVEPAGKVRVFAMVDM